MDKAEMYEEWLRGAEKGDTSSAELRIACDDVRKELEKHGDFYEGFVASARSALDELPCGEVITNDEVARFIVDRITGEI